VEPRPKIKLQLSAFDKMMEVAGLLMLLGLWVFALFAYFNLPDIIPTHFNVSGKVDKYGSKTTVIILAIFCTILFIGLSILNKFPNIFNYAIKITSVNAAAQYTLATRMLRILKLSLTIVFTIVLYFIYSTSLGKMKGIAVWFLPFVFCILLIPTIYFIVKSFKAK